MDDGELHRLVVGDARHEQAGKPLILLAVNGARLHRLHDLVGTHPAQVRAATFVLFVGHWVYDPPGL